MFEVGFTEIVLILGLALLVLGPEKLPGLVQKVGRWTGRARSMARQLRTQLEQEVTLEEMSKSRPSPPPYTEPSRTASADTQQPGTAGEPSATSHTSEHNVDPVASATGAEPHIAASHAAAGTPSADAAPSETDPTKTHG